MNGPHAPNSLAARIALLLSDSSANAFAQKCGLSEGSIRQYLNGSIPRMDKVVTMARVSGVRLEWLATGEGPMFATEASPTALDEALLGQVIEAAMRQYGGRLEEGLARTVAAVSREIYAIVSSLAFTSDTQKLAAIEYALARERHLNRRKPSPRNT